MFQDLQLRDICDWPPTATRLKRYHYRPLPPPPSFCKRRVCRSQDDPSLMARHFYRNLVSPGIMIIHVANDFNTASLGCPNTLASFVGPSCDTSLIQSAGDAALPIGDMILR